MFLIVASVTILPLIRFIFSFSSEVCVFPIPINVKVLSLGLSVNIIDRYTLFSLILSIKILISPIIPCFHSFLIAPDIDSPGIEISSPTLSPDKDFKAISSRYLAPIIFISAIS